MLPCSLLKRSLEIDIQDQLYNPYGFWLPLKAAGAPHQAGRQRITKLPSILQSRVNVSSRSTLMTIATKSNSLCAVYFFVDQWFALS